MASRYASWSPDQFLDDGYTQDWINQNTVGGVFVNPYAERPAGITVPTPLPQAVPISDSEPLQPIQTTPPGRAMDWVKQTAVSAPIPQAQQPAQPTAVAPQTNAATWSDTNKDGFVSVNDLLQQISQGATITEDTLRQSQAAAGGQGLPPQNAGEQVQQQAAGGGYTNQRADEIQGLMDRLDTIVNPAVPEDITKSPIYKAYMDSANIMMDEAGRQIMESLNARGILNSTITGYNVSMARTKIMAQIMPQMLRDVHNLQQDQIDNIMDQINLQMDLDQRDYSRWLDGEEARVAKETREFERAWDRSEANGYVSNDDAIILGIAPGSTFKYQQWAAKRQDELDKDERDLKIEQDKLDLDRDKLKETIRSNKADEATAAKNATTAATKKAASASGSSARTTTSGLKTTSNGIVYDSNGKSVPSLTIKVLGDLGYSVDLKGVDQFKSDATNYKGTNAAYISAAYASKTKTDSTALFYQATNAIVAKMKSDPLYTLDKALADAALLKDVLTKTDMASLEAWIYGSFDHWENGKRVK